MSEILSESAKAGIQEVSINPSENFLNGTKTSAFSSATSALGVVSSSANLVSTGIQSTALIAEITTSCITDIQTKLMECVANGIAQLMTIPIDKFTEAMNNEITDETMSVSDIIKTITKGTEDIINDEIDKIKNQSQEEITDGATSKVQELNEKVTKALVKAKESIDTIVEKIESGPEWVEDKLSDLSYTCVKQTSEGIDQTVKSFEEVKNTWAENSGKAVGKSIVNPINQQMIRAQKSINDKITEIKKQEESKAKAAIAKAVMKIKGLLGG